MSDLISRSALRSLFIEVMEHIKENPKMTRDEIHIISGCHMLCEMIDDAPAVDAVSVLHARWVLEESPYAEHEEAVDGESHPRYVCSNCHQEAGFTCDPDGFAGYQDLTPWCGGCGAKMDGGAEA